MRTQWRIITKSRKTCTFIKNLGQSQKVISAFQQRSISTDSSLSQPSVKESPVSLGRIREGKLSLPPLSVMPTGILIRTLMMTYILSSPRIVSLSIPIMNRISHSKSWIINPDRNPLLHVTVRKLFYDHFCAGENEKEVKSTITTIKKMGFEGVILGYAKETLVDKSASAEQATKGGEMGDLAKVVEEWKEGTLKTLSMLGKGDFLAVKFTGAGPAATDALATGKSPPRQVREAIEEICDEASRKETRLWIDAEQQVFQPAIDAWTTELMRIYNRNGEVRVYNTFQAYLKGTPTNIEKHLKIAQEEGWTLGIKLVRGAYIASEPRHLIHDTVEDTHAAYDSIVQYLLTKTFPGVEIYPGKRFPKVHLMLASHNENSVKKGYNVWRSRKENGLSTIKLEIAQLQGMADEVSCGLVQLRQQLSNTEKGIPGNEWYPRAFKCLCWGATQECIQFLVRRVIENRGSLERTRLWMRGLKAELWRRIKVW